MGDQGARLAFGGPGRDGWLEETGSGVEAWEAMARAGNETKDLGARIEEIEDLGDEEKTESL